MLIKADSDVNSNKFWEAIIHDNGTVDCRWGRVGADGQKKSFSGGDAYVEKKVREKTKEGYREARVVSGVDSVKSTPVTNGRLESIAKSQIKHSDSEVEKLISYLVKVNAHQITTQSGGKLNVNLSSGQVTTPLGVVTKDAITEARSKLILIGDSNEKNNRSNKGSKAVVEDYLMLIPQDIGRGRGWADTLWTANDDIKAQNDLLDSLEATIQAISTTPQNAKPNEPDEKVFNVKLSVVKDQAQMDRIEKLHQSTRQSMHASHHLNIKKVFTVDISTMKDSFDSYGAKLTNIMELWHGTKTSNLLSILKSGLIIPKAHSSIVTGRMFGDGVYFSDQSTKSLNYAYGYWSGGGVDNNCFMFLANVAMGKYYVPSGSFSGCCKNGYESTWAQTHKSGVANNEMIVYQLNQCNLNYLVEFGP